METNELERNIGYVVKALREEPHRIGYNLFNLTLQTRLAHSNENPLGFKDARDAITEAENRGLIVETEGILGKRYQLARK